MSYVFVAEGELSSPDLLDILRKMDETELKNPEMGNTNPKKDMHKKPRLVDDYHLQMIRRKLFEYHVLKREVPTVDALLKCLKEEENFKCTPKTLCKILREDGYRFGRRQVFTVRKESKTDDPGTPPPAASRLRKLDQ